MIETFKSLLKVKSLVTLGLTAAFIVMLLTPIEVSKELLALFSTVYGAVITYFFTKGEKNESSRNSKE